MTSVADLPITYTRTTNDPWADVIDDVNEHGRVLVRQDERPDVVVMSVDEFEKLRRTAMDAALAKLDAELDQRVAVMNAPGSHERWRAFMDATPQEIADAINAADAKQPRNG